jgi:KDO2-lipid IV(A) lauroyltransferase
MSRRDTAWRRLRRRWKHQPGVVPWLLALPQRGLFLLLRLLPDRLVLGLADRVARSAAHSPKRRELGLRHLARALPEASDAARADLLRRSCGHLGRSAAEAVVLWPKHGPGIMAARVDLEPGAAELLDRFRGRGAVVLQAHLGSVEMTTTVLAAHGHRPGTPMRLPRNHYLAQDLLRTRNSGEAEVLPRQGALKRMLGLLREGRAVVLTFDQNAHHKPIFVPWFGHDAATERTPAALALRTGAPVLQAWCVRAGGGRYRFGLRVLSEGGARREADEAELVRVTAEYHRALEEVVLRHPEQYLWIHDRYRSRPKPA